MKYKGSDKNAKQLHTLFVSTPRCSMGAYENFITPTKAQEEGRTTTDG